MSSALTPDRLRRIAEVFESALELEESLRGPYLAALARSDWELVRRVQELLDAQQEPTVQSAPQAAPDDGAKEVVEAADGEIRQIGPYRVVEWLGMGGMGTVYLAERSDEEFERRVAIKVIRLGLDAPEVRRRFLSERQILATFDHPNIAKMYEGGTTPEGLPYLVMEFVEGQPIDRYCDEKRLTVKERLKLFRQVCSAVEYAHRNLVVHRDLKPSNVLVTADGVPKLLDFGIAKLLDPEHFPLTVEATETGHGPLTPNYASPEQIAAERVTTLSDVYSLGVLLYKLLTGRLPFDRRSRSREILAKEAALQEPTRPSLVVGTTSSRTPGEATDKESTGESSLWSAEPSQHRRQLRGDLDNIVLKALRSEPDRRYGSVQLLDDDLDRHLDGLPVRARRAGALYRAGKFVRRHKFPVAAAALFLSMMFGFLLFTLKQNAEIRAARDDALVQEKRAEDVADFFVELFVELSPENARGRELTSREILDEAALRLLKEPGGDLATRSRLMVNLGRIFVDYGDPEAAMPLLEKAFAESRGLGGKVHAEATLRLAQGRALTRGGHIEFGRRAIALARKLDERLLLCEALSVTALWIGKGPEAESLGTEALEIARQLDVKEAISGSLNNLALIVANRDRNQATLYLFRRGASSRRRSSCARSSMARDCLFKFGLSLPDSGAVG